MKYNLKCIFILSCSLSSRHLGVSRNYKHISNLPQNSVQNFCKRINFLTEKQKDLCSMNNQFLGSISKGIKMALEECQDQFKMNHWNCTADANTQQLFGEVMQRGKLF